jgi:hypothetical protein
MKDKLQTNIFIVVGVFPQAGLTKPSILFKLEKISCDKAVE